MAGWKNELTGCCTKHSPSTRILYTAITVIVVFVFFGLFAATLGIFRATNVTPPTFSFPHQSTDGRPLFQISGKIVSFDAINNNVVVSSSVQPPAAWLDPEMRTINPFMLWCGSNQHQVNAGWPGNVTWIDTLPITGNILSYPYDTYTFSVSWAVFEPGNLSVAYDQAISVTSNAIYGLQFQNTGTYGSTFGFFTIFFAASRTDIFKVYPTFQIIAFWVIIVIIGYFVIAVVIWEARRVELPMLGIFPALLFALPAFRNTAPASPPIGCLLDFSSFFWSMLTAILSLMVVFAKFLLQPAAPPPAAPPPPAPAAAPSTVHLGRKAVNGDVYEDYTEDSQSVRTDE